MTNGIIWAPWRAGFIKAKPEKGCVLCRVSRSSDDRKSLIVKRAKYNFIVLNKFPYTSGHIMVVTNRHVGDLQKLSTIEANEHFRLTRTAAEAIRKAFKPEGLNVGMNLGRPAGAGVKGHIHTHLVPRWAGDSNFMPVIGATRINSIDIEETYEALRKAFKWIQSKK